MRGRPATRHCPPSSSRMITKLSKDKACYCCSWAGSGVSKGLRQNADKCSLVLPTLGASAEVSEATRSKVATNLSLCCPLAAQQAAQLRRAQPQRVH